MSYAVRNGGLGWRAVNAEDDVLPDEYFSADTPAPMPPSLAEQKNDALVALNLQGQKIADVLTAGVPDFEKLTWPQQQADALAWHADSTVPTPYIDGLAAERGIDRIDFLQRTFAKTTAFAAAAQKLVGQKQKYEDQIDAAQTPEALATIVPVFTLNE